MAFSRTLFVVVVAALVCAVPAMAEDADAVASVSYEDLVNRLQAQDQRIAQLEKALTAQSFQRMDREELASMMKEIMDDAKLQPALPKWMENLTFYGDVRIRFDHFEQEHHATTVGGSTPKDRNRMRSRLRVGFTKTWWDRQLEVGFRLSTSTGGNARNWNYDWGGGYSKKSIWVDLLYAKYAPKAVQGLTVIAGKMTNPISTQTVLVWEPTITPEGIFVQYEAPFCGNFKPYAEFGYWIVDENVVRDGVSEDTLRDVTYWTMGGGFTWQITDAVKWFLGGTYYDWQHYNNFDLDGPDDLWAKPEMGVLELTTKVNWKMAMLPEVFQPWQVWFSWAHNCKGDYGGPLADPDLLNQDDAYGVGIQVGQNRKKGDFSIGYKYMHIEAFAEPAGFADATFGGPNRKGHIISAVYNIDDFLTFGGEVYMTEPVRAYQALPTQDGRTLVRLQMIWKF